MQADLETTLAQLVSIPSVTTNAVACAEILDFVRNEIEPLGLFISGDANTPNPWFIATTQDTKEPDVLLAAHLDVVPAPTELFLMQKHDGKLQGRGVYDMKIAVACYLEFAKNHADKLRGMNIGFLFTTDEEAGSDCMPRIMESGWRPGVVFIPDGGDNWHVEERAKGLYGVELTARGKAAHGSRPWEDDNALHRLMDVLAILRQSFPSNDPFDSTLAINELHAGAAINQVADYASVKIDFRSFSKDELAIYRAQLEQLAKKHDLEICVIQEGAPLLFDKKAPVVQNFLQALKDQMGEEILYTESYGASDARYFAQYDIPCIIVEPTGGGRHSPDEWLLAEDLTKYYELIEHWLLASTPKIPIKTEVKHVSSLHPQPVLKD